MGPESFYIILIGLLYFPDLLLALYGFAAFLSFSALTVFILQANKMDENYTSGLNAWLIFVLSLVFVSFGGLELVMTMSATNVFMSVLVQGAALLSSLWAPNAIGLLAIAALVAEGLVIGAAYFGYLGVGLIAQVVGSLIVNTASLVVEGFRAVGDLFRRSYQYLVINDYLHPESLDLSNRWLITDSMAQKIAQNKQLRRVDFGWANIQSDNMVEILKSKSLKEIKCYQNRGMIVSLDVAKTLAANQHLVSADFGSARFTFEHLDILRQNTTLSTFKMIKPSITESERDTIKTASLVKLLMQANRKGFSVPRQTVNHATGKRLSLYEIMQQPKTRFSVSPGSEIFAKIAAYAIDLEQRDQFFKRRLPVPVEMKPSLDEKELIGLNAAQNDAELHRRYAK